MIFSLFLIEKRKQTLKKKEKKEKKKVATQEIATMFRDFTGRVDLDQVNNSRDAFKGTTEARAELCLYVKLQRRRLLVWEGMHPGDYGPVYRFGLLRSEDFGGGGEEAKSRPIFFPPSLSHFDSKTKSLYSRIMQKSLKCQKTYFTAAQCQVP